MCVWLQSLQKNANMTKKIIFHIILIWVLKNAEFDADFEFVGKVLKKSPAKKVIGMKM